MATEGEYRPGQSQSAAAADDGTEPAVALLAPSMLAGLDADDPQTTHTAGYGLFVLASAHDTAAASLAEDLVARLAADDSRRDVCRTLAAIRRVDDEAVRQALLAATSHDRARDLYGRIRDAEPWDPPRPLSADGGSHAEYLTAFRQVVRPDDPDTVDRTADPGDGPTEVEIREGDPADDDASDESDGSDVNVNATGPGDAGGSVQTKRDRIEQAAASETFQAIARESGFDDLTVVAPETERRYANVLRARARAGDTERGVAVRLLHTPGEGRFDGLADQLRAWARLVEAPGIVTVVDWGTTPRPWIATEYVEETLARRGRLAPAAALKHARALTGALVQLHQQDVVHGAVDPRNVAYAADTLEERRPMLDNAGLIGVYRQTFDPADYLDPRYAAPEYFDSQYGRLDHATDIYQLGMVVYRLCAGRHPFDGSYGEIREGVLNDRPPAATDCTPALPDAVDEVLAKATAKQKLTRYETAHAFHQDLCRICEAVLD
ncbi:MULTISPECIES: protein kinase domain-containing protein [Salinibaculum]|uniref:protein kinase domain-containing protein n=1 Tax=Salinibaculum TaxID=2732368 RepID=UPI0030D182CF